jgi:transcription elongation factor Elf1
MISPETIQERLGTISCPVCRRQEFTIRTKKENPDGENEYIAHCSGCRYSFPVSTENRLYRMSNPDIDSWLNHLPCPQCGARGADIDFRSVMTIRQIRTFLHCRTCRHEFNEEMPAEAYE